MDSHQHHPAEVTSRHFRCALDLVEQAVMIIDAGPVSRPGPSIVYANQAISSLCGFRVDEVLGRPVAMLCDDATFDAFLERLPEVGRSGRRFFMDVETSCGSGGTALLRWTIQASTSARGEVLNYYVTLSEVRSEVTVRDAQPLVSIGHSSRMESLALVASGIAHDFNNVLTTIMANLSLAGMEDEAEAMKPMLGNALASCESAKLLIGQLLRFAKGRDTRRSVVNLSTLVEDAVRLSTPGAKIRCDVRMADSVPPVEIEPTQMMQVLNNLLINARQSMPNGGVVQVALNSVVLAASDGIGPAPGRYVELRIRDRGCGIPEANLQSIFGPFFTTKREGSGLGLTASKKIIEAHGGQIEVQSKLNVGTEFRILLPVAKHVIEEALISEAGGDEPVRGEGLVMIADDRLEVCMVGAKLLERLGYQAVRVSSGEEAVSEYRRLAIADNAPLAVIMDLTFSGGMGGDDAAREILAFDPDARIIASSGYFETSDDEQIKEGGYAAILPKPYGPSLLSRTLREVLDGDPVESARAVSREVAMV